MGCHTWFYKRIDRTYEEAKEILIAWYKNWIQDFDVICKNPDHWFRREYGGTQEYYDHQMEVYKRQLRMVEKGLCRVAVMNRQPCEQIGQYRYRKGNLYLTDQTLPHDIFRIGGYPEDELFSLEETLAFAEKNEIAIDNEQLRQLKEYWAKHPDGMIEFG